MYHVFEDAFYRQCRAIREERGWTTDNTVVRIQCGGDSGPLVCFTVGQLKELVEFGEGKQAGFHISNVWGQP